MIPQVLDFLFPFAAFLLAQQNFAALLDAFAVAGNWAGVARGKFFLFWSHNVVEFARRTRSRQLVIELATLAVAVAVFFAATGYCGEVRAPRYALLVLLPSVGSVGVSLYRIYQDRMVVPAPYHLAEMKAKPNDPDIDMTDAAAVQARIIEVRAELIKFGPPGASPIPHLTAMIWSPLITAFSILALSAWMGWYGTFRLNGLERYWAMIEGLLACFALALSGLGYKIVVGAARAIVLRINSAIAGPLTAAIRTTLTALPGITEDNVRQLIPAYTGEFLEGMANLLEETENIPIAKLQLLFAMNMVIPHPFTLLAAVVIGYVWKVDFGNQEAVGINIQPQMVDEAKKLSPWIRWLTTTSLALVFFLGASRSTLLAVLVYGAAIINPFLRLGLPEDTTVDWYKFILPFLGGLAVIVGVFYLSRRESLPMTLRRVLAVIGAVLVFVFVSNRLRGGAFQINARTMEETVACGLPPATRPIFDTNDTQAHQHASSPSASVAPPTPPRVIVRDVYYRSSASGASASDHQDRRHSSRRSARVTSTRVVADSSASSAHGLVCCRCIARDLRADMFEGGSCSNARDCERPSGAFCD